MASSLEELLAKEGFRGGRRRVARTRSSFHHGALTEPLYSFEEQQRRRSVSSEGTATHRTKSDSTRSDNSRPRDKLFLRDKVHERLKNESEKKNSPNNANSGRGIDSNSSVNMPRYERQGSSRLKEVSNAKRGKEKYSDELEESEKFGESPVKDENFGKIHSRNSGIHMHGNSYTRSTNSSNKIHDHVILSASNLALDEVAIQAVVSILNGHIKRFLKDEDFRFTMRHDCFSSLNFIELEEETNTETKVIRSLEQAIETIEQTVEQSMPSKFLKRASMQLSIITGLSLNDLKHEFTCGIPNYKLSACAHLYLSVVYMIQRKDKVSAKHLLQVFCDSPFQARTILLPELWESLFSPQLSHLKAWYNKEAGILVDSPSITRRLKLVQKVYNENLDYGTQTFAEYYKDWLTEGVETPSIPSIGIPSVSLSASHKGSSLGHSSESASSAEPFSPQPMVSKKLYDSVFGTSGKTGVYEGEDSNRDEDKFEVFLRGSYSSTIVKQTLTYESTKLTDQDTEDFTQSSLVDTFHQKGTSVTAVEEWKERNLSDMPNKIGSTLAGSYFLSIPQEFLCPLTGTVFDEPITLETGQTYEREAIKAWFEKGNATCPVTGNTLECVTMPYTNLILKRLIDNWKSESFNRLLDFASQTSDNLEELKLKNRDEAAVFMLESFMSSLNEEEKTTFAKQLISLGALSFLFSRFELGNVEEKSHVVALLLNCIESNSDCIYKIAKNVNRKCLLELLHSNEVTPITNTILLLTDLLSMKRRKDVTSFISNLVGEDIFKTLQILQMYLEKSTPHEKPLIAALLLHFDLLVEPKKFSIYREVAVNAIAVALDASLNDDKARATSCRALLILCGHFNSNGKIMTKTSILEEAGYNNIESEVEPQGHEKEGVTCDVTTSLGDDEERGEELLLNLLESLIGDGESPFLKSLCRCLDSRHLDLVMACLITVTWLSSLLCKLFNVGLHLPAFLAIIFQLKGILENGELELKTLASMSLLNFSKISECKTLLKTMAEDIAPLLQSLADVTWTAKQLHAIVESVENL